MMKKETSSKAARAKRTSLLFQNCFHSNIISCANSIISGNETSDTKKSVITHTVAFKTPCIKENHRCGNHVYWINHMVGPLISVTESQLSCWHHRSIGTVQNNELNLRGKHAILALCNNCASVFRSISCREPAQFMPFFNVWTLTFVVTCSSNL